MDELNDLEERMRQSVFLDVDGELIDNPFQTAGEVFPRTELEEAINTLRADNHVIASENPEIISGEGLLSYMRRVIGETHVSPEEILNFQTIYRASTDPVTGNTNIIDVSTSTYVGTGEDMGVRWIDSSEYGRSEPNIQMVGADGTVDGAPIEYLKTEETVEILDEEVKKPFTINREIIREELVKVYVDHYGIERVDAVDKDRYLYITIHFPEIIVKNSLGINHTIRDLYVRLIYYCEDSNKIFIESFNAKRATFTLDEFRSGYNFSHLSSGLNDWGHFCMGGSTPFASSYFRASDSNYMHSQKNFDTFIERTNVFCFALDAYLEWESITGGPYKLLSSVGTYDRLGNRDRWYSSDVMVQGMAVNILNYILDNKEERDRFLTNCLSNSGEGIKINLTQTALLIDDLFDDERKSQLPEPGLSLYFIPYDPVTYSSATRSVSSNYTGQLSSDGRIIGYESIAFKGESIEPRVLFTADELDKDAPLIVMPDLVIAFSDIVIKMFKNLKNI